MLSLVHRSVRLAAAVACAVAVAVGGSASAAVAAPPPAPADAPAAQPRVVGGDVIRHDGIQNLVVGRSLTFGPSGQGSNCDVWNKDGGSAYNFLDSNNNCTTASMNGRTYSWTLWNDTDVFTMQYEGYWLKNRDGSWRYVGANVYTRIHNNENAHCYRESDGVNCYVSLG